MGVQLVNVRMDGARASSQRSSPTSSFSPSTIHPLPFLPLLSLPSPSVRPVAEVRTRRIAPFTIDTIVAAGWPSPLRPRSLVSSTDSICLPRGCLITGLESGPWSRAEREREGAGGRRRGEGREGDAYTRARETVLEGGRAGDGREGRKTAERRNIRWKPDTPSASPFIVVSVSAVPLRH